MNALAKILNNQAPRSTLSDCAYLHHVSYMHNVLKVNFGKKKETEKSPLKLLMPFSFVTSTFQTHIFKAQSLLPKVPMRKSEHSILTLLPKNNGYYRNVIP